MTVRGGVGDLAVSSTAESPSVNSSAPRTLRRHSLATSAPGSYAYCWQPGCVLIARLQVGGIPCCEGHGEEWLVDAIYHVEDVARECGFRGLIVPELVGA